MAMSAAERKRKQREREAAEQAGEFDPISPYLGKPFFEYLKDREDAWWDVLFYFEHAGIEPPEFVDDSGPIAPEGAGDMDIFSGYKGSIGRAEVMIGNLLEAAQGLAELVNDYKSEAISKRLDDLAKAPLGNEAAKRDAMEEAVMMAAIKARLQKGVRMTIPGWSARGYRSQ